MEGASKTRWSISFSDATDPGTNSFYSLQNEEMGGVTYKTSRGLLPNAQAPSERPLPHKNH